MRKGTAEAEAGHFSAYASYAKDKSIPNRIVAD